MTDTNPDPYIDPDADPEQAILQAAWRKAVDLFRKWSDATDRAARANWQGDPDTYGDATHAAEVKIRLTALVTEHGWQRTYVDPDVSEWDRTAYLSPVWPPVKLAPMPAPTDWPPKPASPFPIRENAL